MKHLPVTFTKYGEQFEQVCRTKTSAMYRRHVNGRRKSYEVIVIRVASRKPCKSAGKIQFVESEPYECYPSSEKWGEQGWTYTTEPAARAKYDALNEPHRTPSALANRPIRLRAADGILPESVLFSGGMPTAETAEQPLQLAGNEGV